MTQGTSRAVSQAWPRALRMPWARCVGAVALAATCGTAGAQWHQICYRGEPQPRNGSMIGTAIFGCAVDGQGSCRITAGPGLNSRFNLPGVESDGNFGFFDVLTEGTLSATIDFFDGSGALRAQRSCTIQSKDSPSPGAVLTGFTTDASGLVTTGVWKLQAAALAATHNLPVFAPGDFVAVGGGAMGVEGPNGALVVISACDANVTNNSLRAWRARTAEAGGAAQLHRASAYVIGMRIDGLAPSDLQRLFAPSWDVVTARATSSPAIVAHPAVQVSATAGTVVTGGGFRATAYGGSPQGSQLGQFATVNGPLFNGYWDCAPRASGAGLGCRFVPLDVIGWRAESKDHAISAAGWVDAEVMALPPTISVGGRMFTVQTRWVAATSAEAAHPAVDVGGLRGQYALAGIGAAVDWQRFDSAGNQVAAGNLIWKLQPRADLGGASVASKDHLFASPATITAYAIGIRLVP